MPRVTRSALVAADLLEIRLYNAEDNPTADALLDKIEAACSMLAKSPRAGPARRELARDVRSHPVGR